MEDVRVLSMDREDTTLAMMEDTMIVITWENFHHINKFQCPKKSYCVRMIQTQNSDNNKLFKWGTMIRMV